MWQTVFEILAPVLTALLAILVPALITALFRWFQKLGLDIEATHRDALQSALTNAALIALAKGGLKPSAGAAIDYVRASVPDAVKKFGLDDKRILDLVLPKIAAARLAQSAERPAPNIEPVG